MDLRDREFPVRTWSDPVRRKKDKKNIISEKSHILQKREEIAVKKFLAVLTSLCVCFSMSLPVMADLVWEPTETPPDPGPLSGGTSTLLLILVLGAVVIAALVLFIQLRSRK